MSERLYYTDAYTTRFAARVVERVRHKKQLAVVLDQTYFYPTSGGQPADQGQINSVPVLDVAVRPADGAVLYWLGEGELWSNDLTPIQVEEAELLRVEFCCGRRALRDYRQKNSIVNRLMADLTTGQGDIVEAVGRLREETKQANRIIKKQQAKLLFCRAADAPGEMNQLIKPALQTLGSTAGGGSPIFAQGGGVAADEERVRQAIVRAERLLLGQIR